MSNYTYIPPTFDLREELNQNDDSPSFDAIPFSNLIGKYPFLIVLSKPGNGKSRFLKEFVIQANEFGFEGIFIDLKKVTGTSLAETIEKYSRRTSNIVNKDIDDDKIKKSKDYIRTKNFTLNNSENIIICLDALDEVKSDKQGNLIDEIIDFNIENPNIKIVLSCRSYIYSKFEIPFEEVDNTFLEINEFSLYQVSEYLKVRGVVENQIDKIIARFQIYSRYSFEIQTLNSPRILEIFTDLLIEKGFDFVISKSKGELFETFIYNKLEKEENVLETEYKSIVKQVLEKLALVMEIYETKNITKDELMTFLDGVNSNLARSLLQQLPIQFLYNRSLLISTDNNEIQFENAEFQEYLAAKEIARLDKPEQATFDLVFDGEIDEFRSSWLNTLKYLMAFQPNLFSSIVDYSYKRNSTLDCQLVAHIIPVEQEVVDKIEFKNNLFEKIIKLYHKSNVFINYHGIINKLDLFFSSEAEQFLINEIDNTEDEAYIDNLFHTVYVLAKMNLLDNRKKYWISKFLSWAKNPNFNTNAFYTLFNFLAFWKDIELFKNFDRSIHKLPIQQNDLNQYFAIHAFEANPNDSFSIDLMIEAQVSRRINISQSPTFLDINNYDGLLYFFQKINEDGNILNHWKPNYDFHKEKFKNFISAIEAHYSKELENEFLIYVSKTSHYYVQDKRELSSALIEVLMKQDDYMEIIIQFTNRKVDNRWGFIDFLSYFVTSDNILDIIEKFPNRKNDLAHLILRYENDENNVKIFNKSIVYLEEEVNEIKAYQAEDKKHRQNKYSGNDFKVYESFRFKLGNKSKGYFSDIFEYYRIWQSTIDRYITESERQRFQYILTEVVFKYDFTKAKITTQENNHFTVSNSIMIFGSALKVAKFIIEDLSPYRSKIIEYFPFSIENHFDTYIMDLLRDLSENEIDIITKFYQEEREDDLLRNNISSLLKFIKDYKASTLIPVLKNIMKDENYPYYRKIEVIKVLIDFGVEYSYFEELRLYYLTNANNSKDEDIWYIFNAIDEYLTRDKSPFIEEALKRQITTIKELHNEFDLATQEEIWHNSPYRNISGLQNIYQKKYYKYYIELLEFTLDLQKQDERYKKYYEYIVSFVSEYFQKLIYQDALLQIKELEKLVKKFDKTNGIDFIKQKVFEIKSKYLQEIRLVSSMNASVNKYNEVKQKSYLKIASSEDLLFVIKDIIEKDIQNWVEQEGAYKFISKVRQQEDLIQKTIKTQIENGLLKRGFRKHEVYIRREEQLLDDKRTDFVISYGYVGSVLIEIKLTKNSEVKSPKASNDYRKKLIKYVEGTHSDYGIFLIFQTTKDNQWKLIEPKVSKIYENDDNIYVLGYNCYRDLSK